MNIKSFFSQLNIIGQCRKYGLSVWQCPQFVFFVMGVVIIISSLFTYAIGNRYIDDPQIVALVVIFISLILFILAAILTRSFERMAEASRMKTEFVNIVSHQLRSPLSNFKWVVDLLLSERLNGTSKKQVEYFNMLQENCGRMEELVSNLLIVSKIEQGIIPVKKEEFSLKDLVEEMVRGLEVFAQASNVTIKIKASRNLPKIFADPSQVKLIIENLLDNAIRYTRQNGKIAIKLEKEKNSVIFEIKDNGVGIPKDDQKYIFQKFFRSANAVRHKTGGSGLGLYIVKSIIQKLGGKISFESQENVGSVFRLTLPIK